MNAERIEALITFFSGKLDDLEAIDAEAAKEDDPNGLVHPIYMGKLVGPYYRDILAILRAHAERLEQEKAGVRGGAQLTITHGRDGYWLYIDLPNGKHAGIHLDPVGGTICSDVLREVAIELGQEKAGATSSIEGHPESAKRALSSPGPRASMSEEDERALLEIENAVDWESKHDNRSHATEIFGRRRKALAHLRRRLADYDRLKADVATFKTAWNNACHDVGALKVENERLSHQHDQCHERNNELIRECDAFKGELASVRYQHAAVKRKPRPT